jgi:hypothetical protein
MTNLSALAAARHQRSLKAVLANGLKPGRFGIASIRHSGFGIL